MVRALMRIAPMHTYSLYPSLGGFFFDSSMPLRNPSEGANVHYGPRLSSLGSTRARAFDWQQSAQALLSLYEEARALPKRSKPT